MVYGQTALRSALLPIALLLACRPEKRPATPREMPLPSIQVGACGTPGRDGVMSASPRIDHADRDFDGDGSVESIVVDRAMCTPEGNCYWNVFLPARADRECARYAGTFAAAALEPLSTRGEDGLGDVRGYWNLHGGRSLLQHYRFARGGYQLIEALLCRRGSDDKLECMDDER